MIKRGIDRLICDRCGFELVVDQLTEIEAWGVVASAGGGDAGLHRIGWPERSVDLCPGCINGLLTWWVAPKNAEKAA